MRASRSLSEAIYQQFAGARGIDLIIGIAKLGGAILAAALERLSEHQRDRRSALVVDLARDLETEALVVRYVRGVGRFQVSGYAAYVAAAQNRIDQGATDAAPLDRRIGPQDREIPVRSLRSRFLELGQRICGP
jgi:hypothetical protein